MTIHRAPAWSLLLAALLGCGRDEVLELFPDGGGGGGGGDPACELHADCDGSAPWCDLGSAACVACVAGLSQCGAACVDTARDARHCGGCFDACAVGEVCHLGACGCAAGLGLCAGGCVDTHSDPAHCGGCDQPCAPGQICQDGGCHQSATCAGGLTACAAANGAHACVDLLHGPACGSCGVVCGPGEVCVAGSCRAHAPATPCSACPCDAPCHATFGPEASCCEGVLSEPGAFCVAGPSCP